MTLTPLQLIGMYKSLILAIKQIGEQITEQITEQIGCFVIVALSIPGSGFLVNDAVLLLVNL